MPSSIFCVSIRSSNGLISTPESSEILGFDVNDDLAVIFEHGLTSGAATMPRKSSTHAQSQGEHQQPGRFSPNATERSREFRDAETAAMASHAQFSALVFPWIDLMPPAIIKMMPAVPHKSTDDREMCKGGPDGRGGGGGTRSSSRPTRSPVS